jgi:RNA polymerase sigma-70 factor (ECF subfamily)
MVYPEVSTMDQGAERQFCELYRKYYFYIYKRAFYFFYNQELSHDIAQEVFYKVVVALEKGNREVLKIAYLTRLATNLCIDHLRKEGTRPPVTSDPAVLDKAGAVNGQSQANGILQIHEVLQSLPGSLREIAVYRLLDGHGLNEIAEITGMPKRTLQRRLDQIKKRLAASRSD